MAESPGRFGLFWKTLNLKKLITDPVYRSSRWLYLTRPAEQQQVTTYTELDRYPLLFGAAKQALQRPPSRILSYGCSTGEEVASLRRVFPNAELVGADINPAALRAAESQYGGEGIRFVSSRADELSELAPFDAIFCMAVLQRFPSIIGSVENLDKIYPFDQFASEVQRLHEMLRVNGLLILHLTSYRFSDTPVFPLYEAVPSEIDRPWNPVTFAADGSRIRKGYGEVIFRRIRT